MIFNSLAFFVFFPIVTLAYYLSPHRHRWMLLLAASYYFYGFWRPSYVAFLLVSTVVDFSVGLLLGRVESRAKKRALLVVSLALNFGLLFFFKYLHFASTSLEWLLHRAGANVELPVADFVLPIGISFYTFQTVSYVLDVYRGEREPERHLGKFALFVAFFPHLVAGPIVRAKKLLPQFSVEQRWDTARALDGLGWMLWGLFKKSVIADRAAAIVAAVYADPLRFQGGTILVATYVFAFQIYCDFSGYSDIAVGTARILGIELTRNFDDPYSASSLTEFWRRWHISLSTWFRDYVYLPLGGNRTGRARHALNLFVVFLLSGLWHGANWTFVVWGAFHGLWVVAESLYRNARAGRGGRATSSRAADVLGRIATFHVVCAGWVFFRAPDVERALQVFGQLTFSYPRSILDEMTHLVAGPREAAELDLAILLASIVVLQSVNHFLLRPESPKLRGAIRSAGFAALAVVVALFAVQTKTPFIYFQF